MTNFSWYQRLDFLLSRISVLTVVGGIALASYLIPRGVDAVAMTTQDASSIIESVAQHPLQTRVGYFLVVIALLAVAPATGAFRRAAIARGSRAAEIGWRLIALGSAAGAIGNAFAPLILPSVVGLDRDVMALFVTHHETSGASFGIIFIYFFMSIGAIPFAIGLFRSRTVPLWRAVTIGIGIFAILPAPLGPFGYILAIVLGVGLIWPPDVSTLSL